MPNPQQPPSLSSGSRQRRDARRSSAPRMGDKGEDELVQPSALPARRLPATTGPSPLHVIGLILFAMPFVAIPVAAIAMLVGGPIWMAGVPVAFLASFIGVGLIILGSQRMKRAHEPRGGMRGDHPLAEAADWSPSAEARRPDPSPPKPPPEIRCLHCGVWNEPTVERGVRVCARCGAALQPS